MIKMELTKSFAHLTNIIYVNLGRPHKSFFSWIEIIHHPPWWNIISIIVIQTQQPIPHQHLGDFQVGCLEAGMSFRHYKMSALEHHLTYWLKNKKENSIPYWPTFWFQSCAIWNNASKLWPGKECHTNCKEGEYDHNGPD